MSEQSSRGAAWQKVRLAVLDRDGWICAGCGKPLDGADATVDHVVPKNLGGADEEDNLVAMCRTCNGRKSDRIEPIRQNWINPRWLTHLPQ